MNYYLEEPLGYILIMSEQNESNTMFVCLQAEEYPTNCWTDI